MSDTADALARALAPQSAQNREQRVQGLVTARVEKIEDDGTYRLKFFGMNGQDDDDHSAPARVMMPMAGGGRGMHFFPEPGDEVVVGFLVGDTNNPIILGAVWNRDSKPPDQARQSSRNDVRTIVTRSGHELTFDDTAGRQKITLKSHGGHTVVLDDSPLGPKITVATKLGRKIVLDDFPPGRVAIQTLGCQVTLADPGVVSIQATASIALTAPTIALNSAALSLGGGAGSATIDGVPFKLHTHAGGTLPGGVTGPVTP
ncbi:MAG: phage baseplate assembly protein V [Vicinamibacterales bacterium]